MCERDLTLGSHIPKDMNTNFESAYVLLDGSLGYRSVKNCLCL